MRKAFYAVAGLSATVALPLYTGLALLAPELIRILFGSKWEGSVRVMQVLCIAGITQAVTAFIHPLAIAIGRVRNELHWSLAACGLYMVRFAVSVHFGIVAVAWSIAIVSTLLVPMRIFLIKRWIEVSVRPYLTSFAAPCAATATMAAALLILTTVISNQHVVVSFTVGLGVGAVCYCGTLALLDRNAIKSLVRLLQGLYK